MQWDLKDAALHATVSVASLEARTKTYAQDKLKPEVSLQTMI